MKKIKLFDPVIGLKDELAVRKVLRSRFWASGAGVENVLRFERKFNKYIGSNSCVALNSGTAALHLALSLADIKNKEVILPSLSFVSTAHAIIYNGGKPKFVDVDPDTLCIDPILIEKAITKDTKIILPVHFAGLPCDLSAIENLCDRNNIDLIEDAAHAAGASYNNKKIGSHSSAVCFSFHPVKNLAMPTGGAITLNGRNSKKFEKMLKSRRWCGITHRKNTLYDVSCLGWNYYMNEFSAAIGLVQLDKLDVTNDIRRKIAKRYARSINLDKKMPFNSDCSYHFYWIQVKDRKNLMKRMAKKGIETGIHYRPIHTMKFYKGITKLPITEETGGHIVSLPTHPNLSEDDQDRIIKLVNELS
jgi:dTDP-4-amino-4,6-dideoxygalactose transaminase